MEIHIRFLLLFWICRKGGS